MSRREPKSRAAVKAASASASTFGVAGAGVQICREPCRVAVCATVRRSALGRKMIEDQAADLVRVGEGAHVAGAL